MRRSRRLATRILLLGAAAGVISFGLLACSRAADPSPSAPVLTPSKREAPQVKASERFGIGINLGTWANYTPDLGTIDQMKRASPWLTQCDSWRPECKGFGPGGSAWDTLEEAQLELDAEGWLRRMPPADDASVRFRKVSVALYAAGSPQAGEFVVRYTGRGKLTYGLAARKLESRSSPGRDVIDVISQVGVPLLIELRETDPKDPLRQIRVFPPGGACAGRMDAFVATARECQGKPFVAFEDFPETQRWHPHFISDLKGFRTLRFMDWGNTNRLRPTPWSKRPRLTDPTWATENGPPYEAMFDLARATGADPWINLPTQSTDEDTRAFARLARAALAPGQTLNLEYSNEPWNFAFSAAAWMRNQGQARWPDEARRGGDTTAFLINWYAQRSIELCRLVKAEFAGEAGRVRCILNSQAANPALTEMMLACPLAAKALGRACSQQVDAIAIAPYFGHYLSTPRVQPVVQAWLETPDGGLGSLFAELRGEDAFGQAAEPPLAGAGSGAPHGALALTRSWMEASMEVAKRHSLPLWAYEGGQHLTPPQNDPGERWQTLMARANRDVRMGQAQTRSLQDWREVGGQTYVFYNHLGAYSRYGFWGQKEKPLDDSAAKWQALLKERDR